LKEAFIKATGKGLTEDLAAFSFDLARDPFTSNYPLAAPAQAGVQGNRSSLAPSSCQGQALGSRFRGNDDQMCSNNDPLPPRIRFSPGLPERESEWWFEQRILDGSFVAAIGLRAGSAPVETRWTAIDPHDLGADGLRPAQKNS
jgi:hypothetical protein